ncbi:MAG: hypothetical protein OSA42_00255 [Porticoccaceae bacterium]|nr:hypothetical protein [Porticoccaceae bacterium]
MEMLFLLPLLVLFYFWHLKSITANRPYQALVSAYLVVVACIPSLFKVFELMLNILPDRAMAELFDVLKALNAIAI